MFVSLSDLSDILSWSFASYKTSMRAILAIIFLKNLVMPSLHLACDDRTMPKFPFLCGLST